MSRSRIMVLKYNPIAVLFVVLLVQPCNGAGGQLRVGFYSKTCPDAEAIVFNVVKNATAENPRIPPGLLRLSFHDCFIEGCDGSILLQGPNAELHAFENQGLEGFEEINKAKSQIEAACPGVVSCADILAPAARDSISLSGGPFYEVPTGRRDGRISSVSLAANMPDAYESIDILKSKFREKGLSDSDLVLLTAGGHSIGTIACFFMHKRLENFSGRNDSDPAIDPNFLPQLKAQCPPGNANDNWRIPLDWFSETVFDEHILLNIRNGWAVVASDARLNDDNVTKQVLDSYVSPASRSKRSFEADFAAAMVKMGNIGIKTGSQGEIRRVCGDAN